jgi:hypothetical protein
VFATRGAPPVNKGDQRGKLDETVFTYRATKDGKIFISWQGNVITTLSGERARKLLLQIHSADHKTEQLALAKATGHFKHGNER